LNRIRKIKYLTDQFQLCFLFALATLNSSDVVETVTLKTKTSLKLRYRGFTKNSETRDLKFENETSSQIPRPRLQNLWILPKLIKKMSSPLPKLNFFSNFSHYSDLFHCLLSVNAIEKKLVELQFY